VPHSKRSASLPSLYDAQAWEKPATFDEANALLALVTKDLDAVPGSPQTNARIIRHMLDDDVTVPELMYARRMMKRDPDLDKKIYFGRRDGADQPISYADFAKYIFPVRDLRHELKNSEYTRMQLTRLMERFPGMVEQSMFGKSGETSDGAALYRFFQTKENEIRALRVPDSRKMYEPVERPERTNESIPLADWYEVIDNAGAEAEASRAEKRAEKKKAIRAFLSSKNYKPAEQSAS